MKDNIYDIDFSKLVQWLIPDILKKDRIYNLINCAIKPIKTLHQDFKKFRLQNLYELSITPQVCYLQKLLNNKFDYIERRITIVDAPDKLPPQPYYQEIEEHDVAYYTEAEDSSITYYTESEVGETTNDFIIVVPAAISFDVNEMISLIKPFKLAGARFSIQII